MMYDLTIKYNNGETVTVEANVVNSEQISVNEIDYFYWSAKEE